MPNKSKWKYIGTKNGDPYYEAPPFVVKDRTPKASNRKVMTLPDLNVTAKKSFAKSVQESAKKGMRNLKRKSSK